ncbi:MAG: cohesin domain-containing protein [Candidatus Poribacteria bacterium]|nr:cohesin domain-containing protein [Candidatus Poribacteria bacterium]
MKPLASFQSRPIAQSQRPNTWLFGRSGICGWLWLVSLLIPVWGWAQAIVFIDPPEAELPTVGETLTLQVKVDQATKVVGFQFTVTYDLTALEFIPNSVVLGDFLPDAPKPPFSQLAAGQIGAFTFFATAFGQTAAKTAGVLAEMKFKVLKFQPSTIKLVETILSGPVGKGGVVGKDDIIPSTTKLGKVVLPAEKPPESIVFTSPTNQAQLSGTFLLKLEYGTNWFGQTVQIVYSLNGGKKNSLAKAPLTGSGQFEIPLDTLKQARFFPSGNYQIGATIADGSEVATVSFQLRNLEFILPTAGQAFNDEVPIEWDYGPSLEGQKIILGYSFAGKTKALVEREVATKTWAWPISEFPGGDYQLVALFGDQILASVPLKIDHTLAKPPRILPIKPLFLDPELSPVQVILPELVDPLPDGQVKWEIVDKNLEGIVEVIIEAGEIVVEVVADEGDGTFSLVAIDQKLAGTGRERSNPVVIEVVVGFLPLIAMETDFGLSIVSPKVGQTFDVASYVLDADPVTEYALTVRFDPTALKFVQANNGEQILTDNFPSPIVKANTITVVAKGEPDEEEEEPNLAYLTFEVVEVKASSIELIETSIFDLDGYPIPHVIDQPVVVKEKAPTLFDFELPSPIPNPTNDIKLTKDFANQLTKGEILEEKPFTLDLKLFLNKIHPDAITEWFSLPNDGVDIEVDTKTGIAKFTPLQNVHGQTIIKVGAVGVVDKKEGEVTTEAILNITPVAEPPELLFLKSPPLQVSQGEKGEFDTDDLVFDDDQYNDELTWTVEGSEHLDAFVEIVDLKAYLIIEPKDETWAGIEEITITVTDRNKKVDGTTNLTSTGRLKVFVRQTGGPPIFITNTISFNESKKVNAKTSNKIMWEEVVSDNDPVAKLDLKIEKVGDQIEVIPSKPTKPTKTYNVNDDLVGRTLASSVVDLKTSDSLLEADIELTQDDVKKLQKGGITKVEVFDSESFKLTFTAKDNDWHGTETVTISVTDTDKEKTTQDIKVTVTPVAEKPRNNPDNKLQTLRVIEDQDDFEEDLSLHFTDDEDDPAELKFSAESVPNLEVEIDGAMLRLVPKKDWNSSLKLKKETVTITLVVEDSDQEKLTTSVQVTVLPQADDITFDDFNVTFTEDEEAKVNLLELVESVDFGGDTPEAGQVTFSKVKAPKEITVKFDHTKGEVTFKTTNLNWFTKEDIVVELRVVEKITQKSKTTAKATIKVNQVLDRPIITSMKIDSNPYDEFATRRIRLNIRDPDAHWEAQKVWVSAFYQTTADGEEDPVQMAPAQTMLASNSEAIEEEFKPCILQGMNLETQKVEIASIDDIPMQYYTRYTVAWFAGVDDLANTDKEVMVKVVVEDQDGDKTEKIQTIRISNTGRKTPQFQGLSVQYADERQIELRLAFQEPPTPLPNVMMLFRLSETERWHLATVRISGEPASDRVSLSSKNGKSAVGETDFVWDLRLSNVQQAGRYDLRLLAVSAISDEWKRFTQIATPKKATTTEDSDGEESQDLDADNATINRSTELLTRPRKGAQILGDLSPNERITVVAKRGNWYYISIDKDLGFGYLIEDQTRGYVSSRTVTLDDTDLAEDDEEVMPLPPLRAEEIVAAGPFYDQTVTIQSVEKIGKGLVHQIDPPSRIITPGLATYNDQFILSFRGERPIVESRFSIYTPSGQLIFETDQAEQQNQWWRFIWNGKTQQGALLPSGAYFYVLTAGYTDSAAVTSTDDLPPDIIKGVCVIAR